jgi:hypothetical protein
VQLLQRRRLPPAFGIGSNGKAAIILFFAVLAQA